MDRNGRLPPGLHFLQGNIACAEGAIAAGCRFFAGYPITPATEIAERMAERLPEVGGVYIQMEDEIGSIGSVIGASWTGVRAMTATSGPGFSLMQEGIGHAVGTETPCVIVDVQRGGRRRGSPGYRFRGMSFRHDEGHTGNTRSSPLPRHPPRRCSI
jgi:2-oxoglutarate ferredoxin oxidoreductase subunit alpha